MKAIFEHGIYLLDMEGTDLFQILAGKWFHYTVFQLEFLQDNNDLVGNDILKWWKRECLHKLDFKQVAGTVPFVKNSRNTISGFMISHLNLILLFLTMHF